MKYIILALKLQASSSLLSLVRERFLSSFLCLSLPSSLLRFCFATSGVPGVCPVSPYSDPFLAITTVALLLTARCQKQKAGHALVTRDQIYRAMMLQSCPMVSTKRTVLMAFSWSPGGRGAAGTTFCSGVPPGSLTSDTRAFRHRSRL